ncbi:MAG TPA: aminotransferase class IV, partial [Pirellulales bacterium]|nr:aminotransferase class IV [Pirellulales bacterium]
EMSRISQELVEHNAAVAGDGGELALVHFVSAGEHAMYAARPARPGPTACAHTFPLRFERWAKQFREGVHVVTPAVRQIPPQCVDPRIKCRSRMHYYLADRQARAVDPEAVALLLDLDGHVTETNGANFLMVRGGGLVSPPSAKTLAGVSRATVLQLAARLGIGFSEVDLTVDDVLQADEAMLSGTPYCLLPVTRINSKQIGDGRPGKAFQRLIAAWSDEVGIDIALQIGSIDGG